MYYNDFKPVANMFELMDDSKAGVPRTAYNGIVSFKFGSNFVLLVPHK